MKLFQLILNFFLKKVSKHPFPTVDIIISEGNEVVLIKRKNPPLGWALPGGFVEYGESLEEAACREVKEETNLTLKNLVQFHTYSQPNRDPRSHTISTVFIAKSKGEIKAQTDAAEVKYFSLNYLPQNLAFDHQKILEDYIKSR